MFEIIRGIINAMWMLLNIPFEIDGIRFTTWHIVLAVSLIAAALNGLYGKAGGGEG